MTKSRSMGRSLAAAGAACLLFAGATFAHDTVTGPSGDDPALRPDVPAVESLFDETDRGELAEALDADDQGEDTEEFDETDRGEVADADDADDAEAGDDQGEDAQDAADNDDQGEDEQAGE